MREGGRRVRFWRRRISLVLLFALAVVDGCGVIPIPRYFGALRRSYSISTAADRRALLAEGFELRRSKRYDEALDVAEALLSAGYPGLEDYVLFLAGESYLGSDRRRAARDAYARLLTDYPHSVLAPEAGLSLGKLLQRDRRDAEARRFLERAKYARDADTRAAAHAALAASAIRLGQIETAHAELQEARRIGKGSPSARAAKDQALKLRSEHSWLSPVGEAAIEEMKLLLGENDSAAAIRFAQTSPLSDEPAALQLRHWYGRALFAAGRTEEAYIGWWELVESFPDSPAAADSLYRIATTLWNRDRDAAAARAYREFLARYPGDARAADSLYALGRIEQTARNGNEAVAWYDQLRHRFPGVSVARDAQWRTGWIRYRQGDYWEAAKAFADLADVTRGRERDEANYWRARSHQRGGRLPRAVEIYAPLRDSANSGYYALLATHRLRGGSDAELLASLVVSGGDAIDAPTIKVPSLPRTASRFHGERWRELRAAGMLSYARLELDAVEESLPRQPVETRFLLDAYRATEGHDRAVKLYSREASQLALSDSEKLEVLYPLAYWPEVQRAASENELDPLLLLAIMRQESSFDPEARSHANARGLLQLLPKTARGIAEESGAAPVEADDLYLPGVNVRLASRYLRSLLQRYDGNLLKAVAAYNGGEAAVDKWQARFGDGEADEFVESISYRETRDYVKRVIHNYEAYRRLYRR